MITTSVRGIPIDHACLPLKSYAVTKRIHTLEEEMMTPIGTVSDETLAAVLSQIKENF